MYSSSSTPTPEEQAEYFRLQKPWVEARSAHERNPEGAAEQDLAIAEMRLETFKFQHWGEAFRVFSDELIESMVSNNIEPLELGGMEW